MKARNKRTGEIVDIEDMSIVTYKSSEGTYIKTLINTFTFLDAEKDYYTKLEHQYAGMAMQGLLSSGKLNIIMDNSDVLPEGIAIMSRDFAHALVKKVRYEENPKELEGLKKELEALKIEKTILENKIKLLTEERK